MKRIHIPTPNLKKYSFNDSFFSIGSCFSENISLHLNSLGIKTFSNPFGVVYNPYSVYQQLLHITAKDKYSAEDLSFYNGKYFLFCHSAGNDNVNPDTVLNSADTQLQAAKDFFSDSSVILITLGSAVVYETESALFKAGENEKIITANCHRVPQSKMTRRLLSHDECCEYISNTVKLIKTAKPDVDIFFTVSPAKHYPGEPLLDSVSKSRLKSALAEVLEKYDNTRFTYFPSYEIFHDELCGREWYKNDGTHPNKKAVSFIMKRFVSSSFNRQTLAVMKEISAIKKLLRHRPTNPESNANYEMLKKIIVRLNAVKHANTTSLRIETACRLVEYFYGHEETDKLINDLFSENNQFFDSSNKKFIFKLLAFFRKECDFTSLPTQLFSDKRLSSMLISFLTKNGV